VSFARTAARTVLTDRTGLLTTVGGLAAGIDHPILATVVPPRSSASPSSAATCSSAPATADLSSGAASPGAAPDGYRTDVPRSSAARNPVCGQLLADDVTLQPGTGALHQGGLPRSAPIGSDHG